MKTRKSLLLLTVCVIILGLALAGCKSTPAPSGPVVRNVVLEEKGTAFNIPTPEWVKIYITGRISAVQALPEYQDKYCVIGTETGVNKQFVLAWADSFSAQQQIGAMIRTNIASAYTAQAQGRAQSSGGANSSSAQGAGSGSYEQSIDNAINSVVEVQYSGAQREGDWWVLTRRYDPDQANVYTDEYTAYVLYTFPKASLNQQIANALISTQNLDPEIARMSAEIAREIMAAGLPNLGE
jgi:hypothetical protein